MSPLLHVQQKPCAYLPSSKIYKCYRCVVSSLFPACSAGAVCLLARQQNNLSTDVISSMFPAYSPGAVGLFVRQQDDLSTDVLYPRCFLLARSRVPICPTARTRVGTSSPSPRRGWTVCPTSTWPAWPNAAPQTFPGKPCILFGVLISCTGHATYHN